MTGTTACDMSPERVVESYAIQSLDRTNHLLSPNTIERSLPQGGVATLEHTMQKPQLQGTTETLIPTGWSLSRSHGGVCSPGVHVEPALR